MKKALLTFSIIMVTAGLGALIVSHKQQIKEERAYGEKIQKLLLKGVKYSEAIKLAEIKETVEEAGFTSSFFNLKQTVYKGLR